MRFNIVLQLLFCDYLNILLTIGPTCLIINLFCSSPMTIIIDIVIYECHPAKERPDRPINFTEPQEFCLSCIFVFVIPKVDSFDRIL